MQSARAIIRDDGDNPFASERFEEKAQLQNISQRFSNYIYNIRQRREQQIPAYNATYTHDEKKWSSQIETMRSMYDQQIADLRNQLALVQHENNELEGKYSQYGSMSTEFQGRISSLNETVLKQTDQIALLQISLTDKETELQKVQSQIAGSKTELETCKMEREGLKRRLSEAERRFLTTEKEKFDCQNQFTDFHTRYNHEILMYQQQISDLQQNMEASRHTILNLEGSVRNSGQQSGDVAQMMMKAREASETELKRYMEATEYKHNLNISEIKMQMETDAKTLTTFVEENGRLRTDLNNAMAELNMTQSKLTATELAYKIAQSGLESERKGFEIRIQQLDKKLQGTQELLLVKVKELNTAQDANIPLKAEIDFIKNLIEEEEKRLGLEANHYSALKSNATVNFDTSTNFHSNFASGINHGSYSKPKDAYFTFSTTYPSYTTTNSVVDARPYSQSPLLRRPSSAPLAVGGRAQESADFTGADVFTTTLAGSKFNNDISKTNDPQLEFTRTQSLTSTNSSLLDFEKNLGTGNRASKSKINDVNPGLRLLPRPVNPTPPQSFSRRPSSAIDSRYIPADAGQGRNYFDAMFNDLRRDTMYSKVTEKAAKTDNVKVTSLHQDLVNSTSSHNVKPSKSGLLWYSGSTASATGNMKLVEIDEDGKFVRIHNASATRVEDIGGCLLQQNVAGHPVAVFRFPPRTKLQPGNTATVWSAKCKEGAHDPPSHYIWKELDKWGTGPECTTILCKANGQAVAWMTSAPRISRISRAYQHHRPDAKTQVNKRLPLMSQMQKDSEHEYGNGCSEEADYRGVSWSAPSFYKSEQIQDSDSPYLPIPNPPLRRNKPSNSLPNATGKVPIRKYVAPPIPFHQHSQVSAGFKSGENLCARTSSSYSRCVNCLTSAPEQTRAKRDQELKFKSGVTSVPHLSSAHGLMQTNPSGSARITLPGTFLSPGDQHRLGLERLQSNYNLSFLPPLPRTSPQPAPCCKM